MGVDHLDRVGILLAPISGRLSGILLLHRYHKVTGELLDPACRIKDVHFAFSSPARRSLALRPCPQKSTPLANGGAQNSILLPYGPIVPPLVRLAVAPWGHLQYPRLPRLRRASSLHRSRCMYAPDYSGSGSFPDPNTTATGKSIDPDKSADQGAISLDYYGHQAPAQPLWRPLYGSKD